MIFSNKFSKALAVVLLPASLTFFSPFAQGSWSSYWSDFNNTDGQGNAYYNGNYTDPSQQSQATPPAQDNQGSGGGSGQSGNAGNAGGGGCMTNPLDPGGSYCSGADSAAGQPSYNPNNNGEGQSGTQGYIQTRGSTGTPPPTPVEKPTPPGQASTTPGDGQQNTSQNNANQTDPGTPIDPTATDPTVSTTQTQCDSDYQTAVDACVSPLGASGGSLGSNAGILGISGAAASVYAGINQANTLQASGGVSSACGLGAGVSEIMTGAYGSFATACEAARTECMNSCNVSKDAGLTFTSDYQPTAKKHYSQCAAYATLVTQATNGIKQYGQAIASSILCEKQAQANQALLNSGNCQDPANANTAACQALYAANPCAAPNGATTPACICQTNPHDPVCASLYGGTSTTAANALTQMPGSTISTTPQSLVNALGNGGNGALDPIDHGNPAMGAAGSSVPGLGAPIAAANAGSVAPPGDSPFGSGGPSGPQGRAGVGPGGYNTNIEKGYRGGNGGGSVVSVPLASSGGYRGGGVARAPASGMLGFNLNSFASKLAGRNGFQRTVAGAGLGIHSEVTGANSIDNWQKVHLRFSIEKVSLMK